VTLVTIAGWQVTYSSGTIRGVWIPSDVIGDVFFPPNQGGDASTIEAFAVFGEPLMRPIGGYAARIHW
jgi:MHS family proline/betaine transporter-like MFS transporter